MIVLLIGIGVIALLVIGAEALLLSGNAPTTSPTTATIEETPVTTRVDQGDLQRAERLIGGLPNAQVSNLDLAAYNGLFAWRDTWDREIFLLCDKYYRLVDPVLVKAIVWRESSGNPNAVRVESAIHDKSIGLMQVLTETAKWVAPFRDLNKTQIEERLYEPITNLAIGCKYLTWQIGRYGRNDAGIAKVIAAYNAGTAKYDESGNFINHAYVASILGRMQIYRSDFPPLRNE